MENTMNSKNDVSIWGILILVFLFFIVFCRDGFGGGLGCNPPVVAGAMPMGVPYSNYGGCAEITNCEVQKQEIIDSARNLFAIEASGNRTIEAGRENTQRLYDQSARQYEAGLQEKIFDAKMQAQTDAILTSQALFAKDSEISSLKAERYIDAKFDRLSGAMSHGYNELKMGQRDIACDMLTKPPVYGQGVTALSTAVPITVAGNVGCGNGLI